MRGQLITSSLKALSGINLMVSEEVIEIFHDPNSRERYWLIDLQVSIRSF